MPSTFQYTHETDQIAMCIQNESLLEFTLLMPLIAVKFSEYLRDCSIRVFNLDNPPTYNNHRVKKNHLATKSSAQIKLPGLY